MAASTPRDLIPLIAPGAQVEVRDEEWIVRSTHQTPSDGLLVRCIGTSTLVRDTEAAFFTNLDRVTPLRPEETKLVQDFSPNYRTSRLYLEAVLRKTPLPATNDDLAVSQDQLLNHLEYQRRATHKALTGLRPRLLIADAVGLGKTLEVGMVLSELIRRGQGEKILVVTPRHILEQFQHELWTRFAIPLVRLDSEGIQRVRRQIPANRNPFTYYKRAIISIDTLKNVGRYRHHLEGIRWDAVVIDECHNLVNKGTLNNQLARVLAPRTEALILTSATPHNGNPESFAELIRLLDPTAIADPEAITQSDIEHLYVRRHKGNDEVAAEVGSMWADRKPPRPIPVQPTSPEEATFAELADTWTHPVSGRAPSSGQGRSLFPWTLFKAALSSSHALVQTIEARRKTLAAAADPQGGLNHDQQQENDALETLLERASVITDDTASKLAALVDQLKEIGVGPRSKTRVVVFSERIATLDWLARTVPPLLKLKDKHRLVLHGGLGDVKQMDVIEKFGLADNDVRLLFTGDMASEGVNLHRACNHLIHFDLPWSLITIEQRNGRIDRYGQESAPDVRALIQTPNHPRMTGDVRILTRLLEREDQAHRAFGESGSLLGLHAPDLEEDSVMRSLRDGRDADELIPDEPQDDFDLLALLGGGTGTDEVPLYRAPTLIGSDNDFVGEALDATFDDLSDLELRTEDADPDFLSLHPPADLLRRLGGLPRTYLSEQKIVDRLRLTGDADVAERQLRRARESSTSSWPEVGHLSPLHPFVDWLADKVLVKMGRNEAPVIKADVTSPVFCVQGQYSNGKGQPQLVEWMAVFAGPSGALMVDDLFATLDRANVGPTMPNDGQPIELAPLTQQLEGVVDVARGELEVRRAVHDQRLTERLADPTTRLEQWADTSHQLALELDDRFRTERNRHIDEVRTDTEKLIESMRTAGQPLIRIRAVLVGEGIVTFPSITNRGEFFSNHYLDAILGSDLGDLRSRWDDAEQHDKATARSLLRSLPKSFFDARAVASEAKESGRADAIRALNDVVLTALGFHPDRAEHEFTRATVDTLQVTAAATVETPTGLYLVVVDAGFATDVDDLFASANGDDAAAGVLLDPCWREGDKQEITSVPDAVSELFALDDPPRFVLVLGGSIVLLAERAKWAEGRYLAVDLDAALERNDTKAKGELETIAALFSADALIPDDGQSIIDELVENSHKHAVGVSKELRNGIRESIELLANEVIQQRLAAGRAVYDGPNRVDPEELTAQCLRYLYRLLVLLYAESRPELGVLPVNDEAYIAGYSLDRLRELTLVDLDTDASRDGSHIDESLTRLFELVNNGYHADHTEQVLVFDTPDAGEASYEEYLLFPGLDAALFEPKTTSLLDGVTLRNETLQRVLSLLMLSPEGKGKGKGKRADRGFISYAQLGINQLGAVYEGLMAYSGFFATEDLYEVAKHGDPSDGTWMLPVDQAAEYPADVFVTRVDDVTGRTERVMHPRGSFVFRLSGRDRQRSASYYTPEVLTRCVVKHALAELLGLDDYAPEHGSSGITEAVQILDLTICEPALGSGAFLNEAINQLSAEYLKRRQAELGESLDPERYQRELQKVKAHYALHQSYGVDLNATAVELAEVSLWLNAMYPGLKAPWFGLQLRQGNSLIGCRRATWTTSQLGDRPWANTKKGTVQPPVDRKLSDGPLAPDEIHHFLLPGHGWAAVADRKEAKELRPDEVASLKAWRKTILAAPKKTDAKRLTALAAGIESMWVAAAERIRLTQRGLRRNIDIYGVDIVTEGTRISREEAIRVLGDPDSALGRLRTLMDAWVGLWFWPLNTGVRPPSWDQWLAAAEDLIRPDERHGLTGQLDLFDDLSALLDAERDRQQGQVSVEELEQAHSWLAVAVDVAKRDGAWHWDLEFAPVFQQGGFNLQVGNPPWVRPRWYEDLVLAEHDPWWGITEKPGAKVIKARRAVGLAEPVVQSSYLAEVASAEGIVEILGSPVMWPVLAGVQTNLYMVFMDTTWRHMSERGIVGLLHPESHFTDPKAGSLRRATYTHIRRHWQFANGLFLFEDIHDTTFFGIQIYGRVSAIDFAQISALLHPDIVERSLEHVGSGPLPGIQYQTGGWDLRPHRARVLTITEDVLADWARLFDEPGTPASEARLFRPVTTADLEALSVLADQPTRLADHDYHWTAGWHEKGAKTDGTIRWETSVPDSWDEVILQGPHFSVATPFNKQPNENCKHNQDYSDWDLESLPEQVVPRTNYQRACDRPTYDSRLDHWDGKPSKEGFRVAWRFMTQPGLERSLHTSLLPPGPAHINSVNSYSLPSAQAVQLAGLAAALPLDYFVKVAGLPALQNSHMQRFPLPRATAFSPRLALRTLRLNCLTADYAPLWEELFDPSWQGDRWTDPEFTGLNLGDVEPTWSMATPLRRDEDRRRALVELDALAALMLGLTAEQLCAMYRTQFAVLRKYEYKMVFDTEGRKICGYHQSAGYRQAELQDQAKAGDLPPEWKNLWNLFERFEDDPDSVDWLGHYTPPFRRADREAEMTIAYDEFQRRLDKGEYEHT